MIAAENGCLSHGTHRHCPDRDETGDRVSLSPRNLEMQQGRRRRPSTVAVYWRPWLLYLWDVDVTAETGVVGAGAAGGDAGHTMLLARGLPP